MRKYSTNVPPQARKLNKKKLEHFFKLIYIFLHFSIDLSLCITMAAYTVQKEQGVRLVSLMHREIILYMASAMCVSSY
jgi:hypothetical protein